MANKRRQGQTFIGTQVDEQLLHAVEKARGRVDRSLWVRMAIAEKLEEEGYEIPEDWIYPPSRTKNSIVNNSGIVQIGGDNKASISNQPAHEQKRKPRDSAKRKRKPRGSA